MSAVSVSVTIVGANSFELAFAGERTLPSFVVGVLNGDSLRLLKKSFLARRRGVHAESRAVV